jgi:uncharacterized protein YaaW (UPF0174 family)
MSYTTRTLVKETMQLVYLVDQLAKMKDESIIKYYDSLDFQQIESEIKEQKELLISKIEKV